MTGNENKVTLVLSIEDVTQNDYQTTTLPQGLNLHNVSIYKYAAETRRKPPITPFAIQCF